jgi:two-component system invasion response regulator UvrY
VYKIGILDDHGIVREGLVRIIAGEPDMDCHWQGSRGTDIWNPTFPKDLDILLLDLNLPDRSGLEVLKDLQTSFPSIKILVLSMHPEHRFAQRVIQSGAKGYLVKEESPEMLTKAIRKILAGSFFLSDNATEILATKEHKDRSKEPHELLSDREYELLLLLAQGRDTKDAANKMGIALSTAHTFRKRLLEKLKLQSNSDIIHYALNRNLL